MKIMVVGVGVIGTIYGWALSEASHDVIHFVRPGKALKFKEGILMDVLDKRKGNKSRFLGKYSLKLTETLNQSDNYNFVIVPTKHYQLIDALQHIVPKLGNVNYILLTQNWEGSNGIDTLIPESRYLFGDAKAGGGFRDGKLISTIKAIDLGQVNNRHDECLQQSVDLFQSANIKVTVQDNILHYLWVQYAINGGFWPALVRAGSIKALLSDRNTGKLGFLAVNECLEVLIHRGVDLNIYPDTKMYLNTSYFSKLFAGIVLKWMFKYNEYVLRNSAHALSDPKEIKTFFYDLVNTGQELGVAMPVMNSFRQDIDNFHYAL